MKVRFEKREDWSVLTNGSLIGLTFQFCSTDEAKLLHATNKQIIYLDKVKSRVASDILYNF